MSLRLLITGAVLLVGFTGSTPAAEPESPSDAAARMQWWREGRFGMFIHWGPVSLKGTEISWSRANSNPKCPNKGKIPVEEYDNLYKRFDPVNFKADDWAALAREAGMKYVVLTAKHCDGFLLWHSKTDGYNISATPFKRDVCAEFAEAARKEELRVGWYFSPMDWRDPDFRTERNAAFLGRMQGEIRELLANYGRIDLMWFDYDGREAVYDQATTYPIVKQLQPKIVINNRLDLTTGDSNRKIGSKFADYYTPEQQLGSYDDQRPWETCMTLGTQWSWKPDDRIKSTADAIGILARCAGGDGNLLLNVGPMPDGRIEERQAEVLRGMGRWMRTNSQSIYGTRGGPYKPAAFGASTRKGNVVYLHVLKWPGDALMLPALPAKITASSLLGGGEVKVEQTPTALQITVAPQHRDANDTLVKLELDGSAMEIAPIAVRKPGLPAATASNVYHNDEQYAAEQAVDGDPQTRWATDKGVRSAWLQVDYGRPIMFSAVRIDELYDRVRKFQLQYKDGPEWRTIVEGQTIGRNFQRNFASISAQVVRLNMPEALDGPSISEFQLIEAKQ